MPFTQAWDEAVPPDTQAANQLGDNIRDVKRDTRERIIAFSAGRIADRLNPEAVWGDANRGVLYFSTDEKKMYRWNGSAWVDLTGSFIGSAFTDFKDYTPVVVTDPGADTDGVDVSITAGFLQVGSVVEIRAFIRNTAGSVFNPQRLFFGATELAQSVIQTLEYVSFEATVIVTGASAQKSVAYAQEQGELALFYATPAENIANAIVVKTRSDAANPCTMSHEFINVRIRV